MTSPESPEELMRHALGVQRYGSRWKKPYRNYFVGDDARWETLVDEGLAERIQVAAELTGGASCFRVTPAGEERALAGIRFARRWGYGEPTHG